MVLFQKLATSLNFANPVKPQARYVAPLQDDPMGDSFKVAERNSEGVQKMNEGATNTIMSDGQLTAIEQEAVRRRMSDLEDDANTQTVEPGRLA